MLSQLRESGDVFAEHSLPISFPIHFALTKSKDGKLVILCYLLHREFAFAMWTKKSGLTAIQFEPFNSLRINNCFDEIQQFCEQAHAAWSEGQGGDDLDRNDPPTDAGADETPG